MSPQPDLTQQPLTHHLLQNQNYSAQEVIAGYRAYLLEHRDDAQQGGRSRVDTVIGNIEKVAQDLGIPLQPQTVSGPHANPDAANNDFHSADMQAIAGFIERYELTYGARNTSTQVIMAAGLKQTARNQAR